jgi:hypothetical protein
MILQRNFQKTKDTLQNSKMTILTFPILIKSSEWAVQPPMRRIYTNFKSFIFGWLFTHPTQGRVGPTSETKTRDCSFAQKHARMILAWTWKNLEHHWATAPNSRDNKTGGDPQHKGFRPGGRRSFDSWQVGVSFDSLFEYVYGRLFLVGKTAD